METWNGYSNKFQYSASFASSQRDVTYSCGSCGYDLNLNSSSRNTSSIGSKYNKSIKKGKISFFSIDQSRFNQVEGFNCFLPLFITRRLFPRRTKLLCRKCGNHIGTARYVNKSSYNLKANGGDSKRKYDIRIRSLQPSSAAFSTPLVL